MFELNYKIILFVCLLIALPSTVISSSGTNSEIIRRHERTPYTTYNTCGGIVEAKLDQTVVVEYKLDEEYDNDEFCVWEVRNGNCRSTLFTKTQSGFEVGYDYLQISIFTYAHVVPNGQRLMGNTTGMEQVNTHGEINFVIFSTDYSNTGTGFRLEIVGYEERTNPRWHDDFMSFSPIGTTTLMPYHSNMFQSFVIIPKLKYVQSLELDVEYSIGAVYDHISVYSMERNGQLIKFRQLAEHLDRNGSVSFETVYYTNFIVLFRAERLETPMYGGITLTWQAPNGSRTD